MRDRYDDGMPEDERAELEAGLQRALDQAERGEGMTWEETRDFVLKELARRKGEQAA